MTRMFFIAKQPFMAQVGGNLNFIDRSEQRSKFMIQKSGTKKVDKQIYILKKNNDRLALETRIYISIILFNHLGFWKIRLIYTSRILFLLRHAQTKQLKKGKLLWCILKDVGWVSKQFPKSSRDTSKSKGVIVLLAM